MSAKKAGKGVVRLAAGRFPAGFAWGTATSATQVEGAASADGKSPSIWDHAGTVGGVIENGQTAAVACDHYHRVAEDVKLLGELGVKHYRFSINWCRIMPEGGRQVNTKGLDFYKRLADALRKNGITPWATLYHWDLPQALEVEGGWPVRRTVEAFARYADATVGGLRSHIRHWMTINETHTFIQCGYKLGVHAPFRREPDALVWQAHHHVLLAHGHAVRAVREYGGRGAKVGFVHNPETPIPLDESPEHIAAARACYREINGNYLVPLYEGHYDDAWLAKVGRNRPVAVAGDMELISRKTDFLGLNQYGGNIVRAGGKAGWEQLAYPADYPKGGFDWLNVSPSVMYWGPRLTHELFRPGPMYITENGLSSRDEVNSHGEVVDVQRCQWLAQHLEPLRRACVERIPIKGYFHWSFLDNFEWAHGYDKRMGLVHVNFKTLKRTPKLSASVYRRIARTNRLY
jgi:beta-glucosidase